MLIDCVAIRASKMKDIINHAKPGAILLYCSAAILFAL